MVLARDKFYLNVATENILKTALETVQGYLQTFANDSDFTAKMQLAFGDGINIIDLQKSWNSADFSSFPFIEILPASEINGANGANGAFAAATNTIYLAQEFLSKNIDNPDAVVDVLLEEFGHGVDAWLNASDSPGDEGAIFSALVQGESFDGYQLKQLKAEDDTAIVTLDGQVIQIEQASVSDSGGFEGSEKTITLESNGGGIAKYRYQHYTIPDNFIIRYEGKNILQTGFVGGSQTGQVQIPEGNSNQLDVIVATNDEGTAWNYDVTTEEEDCADTTPFSIELAGGKFEDTDGDGDCDGQGTIYIGRTDGIARMLRVENATAEYDDKSLKITGGTVFSEIGNVSEPLFKGNFEIPFSTGVSSSFQETESLASEFQLGGLDINFKSLNLKPNQILLEGGFVLPEAIGGFDLDLNTPNTLLIDSNGVGFGGGKVEFPNLEFKLFDLFDIKSSDASIEYKPVDDLLKIQGKLELKTPFFKVDPKDAGANITLDLAGNNFIQIKDGVTDITGSLSVKDVNFTPKWGVSELSVNIKTQNGVVEEVGGKAQVKFPWPSKSVPPKALQAGVEAGFLLPPPELELDLIGIDVDQLNIPIGATGLFLQRLGGDVKNIAESNEKPLEFGGVVGLTFGPELSIELPSWLGGKEFKASAVRLDVGGTVSSEKLAGNFDIKLIDANIYNAKGNGEYNWDKDIVKANTSVSALTGIITGQNKFTADFKKGNTNAFGQVALTIPDYRLFFSLRGKQLTSASFQSLYTNDGVSSNDYVAAWGQVSIPFYGSTTAGLQVFFDGDVDLIWGAKDVPPTNSFDVETGTEFLLLTADWDNATSPDNVQVRVKDPNGNFIEEADFAANEIAIVDDLTGPNAKSVVINKPEVGNWDLEIVDETGLGEVRISAFRDSVAPTIEITAPAVDVGGGEVTINYEALDSDSDAEIKLFYDNDNEDFDGILIADNIAETDGAGSFVWNTEGVATGDYFVYAMVMDENNAPVFDYSQGKVTVTEEADLSVTQTANTDSVGIGEDFTYTVTVTNNASIESKGVTLIETLPEEVTFVSASVAPLEQSDNILTFNLDNLASSATETIDITVTAPTTEGNITGSALVTSKTFDPNATNDVDILTTTVEEIPPQPVDLSIARTDNPAPINLGENFTYTLTIANNGSVDATGVVVTENLPSGINFVDVTTSQGSAFQNRFNRKVIANLDNIKSGEEATVEVTIEPFTAGKLVVTTSLTSNETEQNITDNFLIQAQTVNPVVPDPADLELTQTVDNANPSIGDQVTFTLTLTNNGPGVASGIKVTDLLPTGLSFVSATPEQGTYDSSTGVWDVGNIRDNLSRTLNIIANVETTGAITNMAEITGVTEADPDSTPNNNDPNEDDQATIILNEQVNTPPTITSNPTFSVSENTTTVGTITAEDPDGNDLIFNISNGADQGLFSINDSGELSFNNAPDFETAADTDADNNYQVQVAVSDGSETVIQDLTVSVTNVNEAPTEIALSNSSVAENDTAAVIGDLTVTDVDSSNFTYTVNDNRFEVVNSQLKLKDTESLDFETENSINLEITATDDGNPNQSFTKNFAIAVTNVNEPPTTEDATFTVDENSTSGTQVGIITATDPENETLTFAIASGNLDPDNDNNLAFAIDPSTGTITVNDKDDLDFEITPTFNLEVTATDAEGLSDTANINVNLNDIPPAQFDTNQSQNGTFTLNGGDSNNLKFTLANNNTENVNEVGVFVVDDENGNVDGNAPGSDGYLQAALQRSEVIFSAISDRPTGFELEDIERVLEVDSDARLGFYLVSNGTTDTALAELKETGTTNLPIFFSDSSNLQVSDLVAESFNLNWSDEAGNSDFTNLNLSVQLTQDIPAPGTELQGNPQNELIDLSNETGEISVSVEVHREAAFDNLIGFYQVIDNKGGIDIDGDGIADFNPGDAGYEEAALTNRVTGLDLLQTDNQQTTTFDGILEGGNIFASFIVVDGTVDEAINNNAEVYFSFLGANSDGVDHIRLLGDNIFGYEDLPGGGDFDYNDMIVKFDLTTV